MNPIDISTMIRLQDNLIYYYSVEDVGIDDINITYYEATNGKFEIRDRMFLSNGIAIEIANAILKLTNKE